MAYFDPDNVDAAKGYALRALAGRGLDSLQIAARLAQVEALERSAFETEMASDLRCPAVQRALSCSPEDAARARAEQAARREPVPPGKARSRTH